MTLLNQELFDELQNKMSLARLSKFGLFQKIGYNGTEDINERELKLHRAVLDKALIDLFSNDKVIRQEVLDWLDGENQDFFDACERAMLKPKLVEMAFREVHRIIAGKNAKFKGFRKRYTTEEV